MCRVPLRELFPENAMIGANLRVSSSNAFQEFSCRPGATETVSFTSQIQNSLRVPRININLIGIRIQAGLKKSGLRPKYLYQKFVVVKLPRPR
jgi:hypothetical protein